MNTKRENLSRVTLGLILMGSLSQDTAPLTLQDVFIQSQESYKQMKEKCAETGADKDCRYVKPRNDIDLSFDFVG